MTLIVAIEPDRRQANYLSAMVRSRLKAELVLAESADDALRALVGRVPDVILTSALLSPKDETVIAEWLRTLDTAAAHVQTLTIPVFAASAPRPAQRVRGMFASFMGSSNDEDEASGSPDGCDPAMFADQCADYLERARAQRAQHSGVFDDEMLEPEPAPALEPEVMVQAMKPTDVTHRAVEPAPPDEFLEFDISKLLASTLDAPAEAVAAAAVSEPIEEEEIVETMEEEEAAAPASDIWVTPRLETEPVNTERTERAERRRPKLEVQEPRPAPPRPVAVRSTAVPPQPPQRRVPRRGARPIQDEWGFFDPDQCGFAALLAKLQEITEGDDPPSKRPA